MALKMSIALALVILLAAVAFPGPAPGLGMAVSDEAPDREFLVLLNAYDFSPPSGASPGVAHYLYYLGQRAFQQDMVPLFQDFQARGYINGFELLDPPNAVLVRTSGSGDRLAAALPSSWRLTGASTADRAAAAQAFQASGPRSIMPLATSPFFWVRETENQVEGNAGIPGDTVTVAVRSGVNTLFTMTTTSDSSGNFTVTARDDQDIAPGNTVAVTASSLNRSLVVPSITAELDLINNNVSGTKPLEADLVIYLWDYVTRNYFVNSVSAGEATTYTAHFASPTMGRADYATANWTNVNGSGDGVSVYAHADFVRIYRHTYSPSTTDKVMGYAPPWTQVTIDLKNQNGEPRLTRSVWTNKVGEYWWHTYDNGIKIGAYDRVSTRVEGLSREPLEVEVVRASGSVEVAADVATARFDGKRESAGGRFVRMVIEGHEQYPKDGVTDGYGNVSIAFRTGYPDSDVDIGHNDTAIAFYSDSNGNQTAAIFRFFALFLPIINRSYGG